ncbi:hypothetical protein FACS189449_03550 [Alphaproteobacteria bacterium]|nr:hypothetical protein FACS189449_03550 [Alphaproteobacteria bacterium]
MGEAERAAKEELTEEVRRREANLNAVMAELQRARSLLPGAEVTRQSQSPSQARADGKPAPQGSMNSTRGNVTSAKKTAGTPPEQQGSSNSPSAAATDPGRLDLLRHGNEAIGNLAEIERLVAEGLPNLTGEDRYRAGKALRRDWEDNRAVVEDMRSGLGRKDVRSGLGSQILRRHFPDNYAAGDSGGGWGGNTAAATETHDVPAAGIKNDDTQRVGGADSGTGAGARASDGSFGADTSHRGRESEVSDRYSNTEAQGQRGSDSSNSAETHAQSTTVGEGVRVAPSGNPYPVTPSTGLRAGKALKSSSNQDQGRQVPATPPSAGGAARAISPSLAMPLAALPGIRLSPSLVLGKRPRKESSLYSTASSDDNEDTSDDNEDTSDDGEDSSDKSAKHSRRRNEGSAMGTEDPRKCKGKGEAKRKKRGNRK